MTVASDAQTPERAVSTWGVVAKPIVCEPTAMQAWVLKHETAFKVTPGRGRI
jgi:hypothetical protein